MTFEYSSKTEELPQRVDAFMQEHVFPREGRYWSHAEANRRLGKEWEPSLVIEELKPKARGRSHDRQRSVPQIERKRSSRSATRLMFGMQSTIAAAGVPVNRSGDTGAIVTAV